MQRVKIQLPSHWSFTTEIPVRITDINYGNHMGNDAFLGILHEARMRWLKQYGWTELLFGNIGLIMVDIEVRLKGQAVYGDLLTVSLAPAEWNSRGFDLFYLAVNTAGGSEVARARTGMVFFDYGANRITTMPEEFRSKAGAAQG